MFHVVRGTFKNHCSDNLNLIGEGGIMVKLVKQHQSKLHMSNANKQPHSLWSDDGLETEF